MSKTMRLTVRMALGFGILVLLILILGIIGVVGMKRVGRLSTALAAENLPEISLANDIERHALSMVPSLRNYGYTDDAAFLTEVRAQLGEVKKFLAEAKALADRSAHLGQLKTAAVLGENTVRDFEALTEQRVKLTEALETERLNSFAIGSNFTSVCSLFQERQTTAMLGKITAGIDGDQLETNLRRIDYLSGIVRAGNMLMGDIWKAHAERDSQVLTASLKLLDTMNARLDDLEKIVDFENDLKRIAECRAASLKYREGIKRFQEKWVERENLARQQAALAASVIDQAQKVAVLSLGDITASTKQTTEVATFSSKFAIVGVIVGALLGIFLAVQTTRSIARLLTRISTALADGSNQVASAASQVSSASQSLAEGASEQAASLEETSASLEEIASMTKRNSENATNGKTLGAQARQTATTGLASLEEMNRTLGSIKSAVAEMEAAVTETQASNQEISKIIKTIDEIAFQTNLLALNAAVEAARAGEAGMGFAVVADEVRALAQRSAQAAKDTASKIEDAVKRSELGGVASTKVVKSLTEVEVTAVNIQQVFGGIANQIKLLDEVIAEIAAASKEQSQGLGEVNTAVSQMDKVTQSNSAAAEENAAASQEMNAQAEAMQGLVGQLQGFVTGQAQPRSTDGFVPPQRCPGAIASGKQVKADRDEAHAAFGQSLQLSTSQRRLTLSKTSE